MKIEYNKHAENSSNIFFNPKYVINYCIEKFRQEDYSIVFSKYKKLEEAWIVALQLLAVSKLRNIQLFMQIISDFIGSPDIVGLAFQKDKNGYLIPACHPIEVFKIPSHSKESFLTALSRKLNNKRYIPQTSIICNIDRNEFLNSSYLKTIKSSIYALRLKISHVWAIGYTNIENPVVTIFEFYPEIQVISVDIEKDSQISPSDNTVIELKSGLIKDIKYEKSGEMDKKLIDYCILNGVRPLLL